MPEEENPHQRDLDHPYSAFATLNFPFLNFFFKKACFLRMLTQCFYKFCWLKIHSKKLKASHHEMTDLVFPKPKAKAQDTHRAQNAMIKQLSPHPVVAARSQAHHLASPVGSQGTASTARPHYMPPLVSPRSTTPLARPQSARRATADEDAQLFSPIPAGLTWFAPPNAEEVVPADLALESEAATAVLIAHYAVGRRTCRIIIKLIFI
jgi:hypothetical protein